MIDKDDPGLIKLDSKNKAAVYDLLFGKATDNLKSAKDIALLYLGSPYYAKQVLEEYNNIKKVNIFTTAEFKFIYEPFEKEQNYRIWYVEDPKDTFKECDMKFDCIIMNPPYQRGLHLKILAEAQKHLADNGNIVSLQPIVKWQEALLFDNESPVANITVFNRISMDESFKLFGINQRCDLGIVTNGGKSCVLIENMQTLSKIKTKLYKAIKNAGILEDKLEKNYNDFPVNFYYGSTIAGHGGHGKACYRITGVNEASSIRRADIGHCRRYNAKNADEQHKVWLFYTNQMVRFIAKEFGFGGIPYKILPFITGFVDENGKTPLDEEWSFERLVNWFSLDYNDLVVIRKSLDTYLHPEEQKVIEETMTKYR